MAHVRRTTSTDPRSLDITPRPLSVRSLRRRRLVDIIDRVRGEFVEMRGFSPTIQQAARLFDLSVDECGRILSGLVDEGFLKYTADGRYRLPV